MTKSIREIAYLWKQDKQQYVKKSTLSAYLLSVENHILPVFGDAQRVTENDVQNFVINLLNGGLGHKTVKDILIVLKMVVKFGAKLGCFEWQDWDIKFPGETKSKGIEVMSIANQKKIMNHVKENFTFRNLGILLCLSAGLRIGEVCALTWHDIDVENRVINVNKTIERIYLLDGEKKHTELIIDTPKTANSIRQIPMGLELLKLVRPLKKIMNGDFYVLTNSDKPTEPRTYRNYYKQLVCKLGLPDLKFHGLRHTFATRCIESKCDYKTVSVLLGHANIATTLNLYVHPNLEQKQRAIDRMLRRLQ